MGEYVGCIYDETRQRPKFIVESAFGFDGGPSGRSGREIRERERPARMDPQQHREW